MTTSQAQLVQAFQAFNELSEQLSGSYQELEHRVVELKRELAAARSDRLEQLAEKERLANRLTQILEALPAGVVVLDGEGVVREVNPTAVQLLDEPLIGLTWEQVAERSLAPGSRGSTEVGLRDGRRISLSWRDLGSEPGRILLLQDVTHTRALQAQVERNQRLVAMGEMAASLAHQIRTPLASALLYTSQLTHEELTEAERSRFAEKALARLQHLERMINDMLAFARGGAMGMEDLPVEALLEDFTQALAGTLTAHRGVLHIDCRVPEARLRGNREALVGALCNLATNALEACGEGAELRLSVTPGEGGRVNVALADNGPGIPPADRDRIFEPFFTTRPQGTGLGLAVVRAVVQSHRGHIDVASEVGGGARFVLSLPCAALPDLLPSGVYTRPDLDGEALSIDPQLENKSKTEVML